MPEFGGLFLRRVPRSVATSGNREIFIIGNNRAALYIALKLRVFFKIKPVKMVNTNRMKKVQIYILLVLFVVLFVFTSVNAQSSQVSLHKSQRNFTTGIRKINFAGVMWTVKSGFGGPGPNNWSDSEETVWVDSLEQLHMKISQINGLWQCAEIYTDNATDYGEHRFFVQGEINNMDKSVVLGLFVYVDDNNEIDIEFSKWGQANRQNVGGFTIQPYTTPGNTVSFPVSLDSTFQSTHFFNWQPDSIVFSSIRGYHEGELQSEDDYIYHWNYYGNDIPNAIRRLKTRINLWLFRGAVPVDTSNLEIVIADVRQPQRPTGVFHESVKITDEALIQGNYPNPFRQSTKISYQLGKPGNIKLVVYDVLGRQVRTLVDNFQPAGQYILQWDGTAINGHSVTSGIYYYQLFWREKYGEKRAMLLIR
ncbi:MAG: T9SS C-terminal target domain-containing protein [Calditrichaeota bacterium]|nr:MAG: T9SS C-terminal target domain-containing protein [Calditrichota bacterium]